MVNKGEPLIDFTQAKDGSFSIDGKSAPKPEEKKEPDFDFKGVPEQPSTDSLEGDAIKTPPKEAEGSPAEQDVNKQSAPETAGESSQESVFKKAKQEWKDKRDFANELEADYARGYEKHVLESSKKLSSLPRRMFGLKPKLTPELQKLKDEADNARKDFNKSANSFLMSDGAERFRTRLEPKVAATLPYVHQQRKEGQDRIVAEGWGENKNLRRALEALGKHKYKLTATAIGISALTTGGVLPVLAAMGAGLIVRGATKEGLTATYVESARTRLKDARKASGENFLSKSYEEMNEEMENLTFLVGAREARTQTAAAVAGIVAGFGTAGYASGLGVEGSVPDVTSSSPEITPGAPNHAGVIPDSGVSFDTTTPEGRLANKEYLMDHFKDSPETLERLRGTSPEDIVEGMKEQYENATREGVGTDPITKPQPRIIPETPATPEAPSEPLNNGERLIEENVGPDENGAEDFQHYENEEDVFAEPAVTHTIEPGGNGWNTMKDHSSVLKDLPLAEQNKWQVKLWDSLTPQEAMDAGFVKSGGDVNLIHSGETINVSMLDQRLTELMQQESSNIPTPDEALLNTPASGPDVTGVQEAQNAPTGETVLEQGSITVKSPLGEDIVINRVEDFNQMNLREAGYLYNAANASDPNALRFIEEMGWDKGSFMTMYESLDIRGEYDADMTIDEWKNPTQALQATPVIPNDITPRNEIQPDIDPRGETDSLSNDPNRFREASFTPEVANDNGKAVQGYVSAIEKPDDGIWNLIFNSSPNITGTWEALNPNEMTVGELKELANSPNLEGEFTNRGLGEVVSEEGVSKWNETIEAQRNIIPANDEETLAGYLTRVTNEQRAA